MIIPFAVDPDSLALSELETRQQVNVTRSFVKAWERYGVLVHSHSKFKESELAEAIGSLGNINLRKMWKNAIKRNRLAPGPEGWKGVRSILFKHDLNPLIQIISLLCLDPVRGIELGLPEEEESVVLQDVEMELAHLDCAAGAQVFRKAEVLAQAPLDKERPQDVWNKRLNVLARSSRFVVVMDRYALSSLIVNDEFKPRRYEDSGVRRFMIELDGVGYNRPKKVCMYVGYPKDGDLNNQLEKAIDSLGADMCRGGIRELSVHFAPDPVFRDESHCRFIRFDDSVVELGTGLEVLAKPKKGRFRRSTFSLKDRTQEHMNWEKDITKHVSSTRHVPLGHEHKAA